MGIKNAEFHTRFQSAEKVLNKCTKNKLLAKICTFSLLLTYTVYDEYIGWWFVMVTNMELVVFQDVVMTNLLGSGGLQVTVSSSIDTS